LTALCGIDEAGRGCLAGPVVAAAVILPADFPVHILNDSKRLSPKKRLEAEKVIFASCVWGIGQADEKEIDLINILQASLVAMEKAFAALSLAYTGDSAELSAIVDGLYCPHISCPCAAYPKADATYPPVMAASILAKCERDRIMMRYDSLYPDYGYGAHKGYPTAAHRAICKRLGPSPIQRRTFAVR
jgi:ribonuclease HII